MPPGRLPRPDTGAVTDDLGDDPGDDALQRAVLERLATRRPDTTICPSEVARALAADEVRWRALMPRVREQAAVLAEQGRVRLTRRGENVTRDTLHQGPLRIAHPAASGSRAPGSAAGAALSDPDRKPPVPGSRDLP